MVQQHRWTIGIAVLLAAIAVTAVVALLNRDAYSSPDDAVRATCHPARIVRDVALGVMWQEASDEPGVGWVASIKHTGGILGGYVVIKCKFQGFTHG